MIGQDIVRGSKKIQGIMAPLERLTRLRRYHLRRYWSKVQPVFWVLALTAIIVMVVTSTLGCATAPTPRPAHIATKSFVIIYTPIRISQMGADCTGSASFMEATVRGLLLSQGIPSPDKLELRLRSGSSICGYAQGVANEVVMPELGARDTAEAEMMIHWSAISSSELRRVWTVLRWMAPAAPPQTASLK